MAKKGKKALEVRDLPPGEEAASSTTKTLVIPGDHIPIKIENSTGPARVRVGPGLHQEQGELVAVKAGILQQGSQNRWWVEGTQKRYVPALGESVLGIIASKHGEFYRVDIGAAHPASLPVLAFEGATKRNRPNLEVGSLIYARVSLANKDMEPELDCIDPATGKAGGFGELKDGFMVRCSLGMARRLLDPRSPILLRLAEAFKFETAVGMNGRVWVNAETTPHIITVARAIQVADGAAAGDVMRRVEQVLRTLDDFMDNS
ncbi:exosome non-catalytic core subunit RRP40 [Spizellomyces punctatus DAOM BR117]|uniref:Ribosomal RNA-processing protein 40 n=1 Tax=Spizellomyces punctatus (strain DAOM BR117) TaxID=645134 RepID=A0A0L0HJX6_SPIPD|nr:exosome non-catalytic core subunit RRP40 [Spizellomyces punctatus DAOM BR117]KND01185.1 hypothetical protein SPPG_04275 [Spizellomyces punctatus DAOM BR117]|eukprot:XP_016609224.1 hypothetical protein SPPG_04275 [Spizellomyces punctatus DAOM BR117]